MDEELRNKRLLRATEAFELLAISSRTLRRLPLPVVKIGRAIRYRLTDIERLITSNTQYVHPPASLVERRKWFNQVAGIDRPRTRLGKDGRPRLGGSAGREISRKNSA
jgi:hypothetical protein